MYISNLSLECRLCTDSFQRALTQPSFSQWSTVFAKEVEVTGSNCGARRPLVRAERKSGAGKGIKAKIICAASQSERERLRHNEQLEFLGDAALEYLCRFNVCVPYLPQLHKFFPLVFTCITCSQTQRWVSWRRTELC